MTKTVYSVSGREVDLSEASTEDLAEVVDGMNDELSRLREARGLVEFELAKRMGGKRFEDAGQFRLAHQPTVRVIRKHND